MSYDGLRYLLESRTPHTIEALRTAMQPGHVRKHGAEQRLVSGWALVSNTADGRPVLDRQQEVVPLPVLADAVAKFMAGPRRLGGLHLRVAGDVLLAVGDVREALIVTPLVKKILDLPRETPYGAAVTAYVASDVAWQMVKDGRLRMFSIGGTAMKRRGVVRNPDQPPP